MSPFQYKPLKQSKAPMRELVETETLLINRVLMDIFHLFDRFESMDAFQVLVR